MLVQSIMEGETNVLCIMYVFGIMVSLLPWFPVPLFENYY